MDGVPEAEPKVIVKPETPFYRSPKILAVFAIFLVVGLGIIFIRYAPDLFPKKTPQQISQILPEKFLLCPLDGNACQIDSNYQESSLSAVLKDPNPVYAVFDGKVEKQSKRQNEPIVVLLTNKEKNLMAVYYFMDAITIGPAQVKEGDVIAVANGNPITRMDNKSFVLHLLDLEREKRALIPLSPKSFKL